MSRRAGDSAAGVNAVGNVTVASQQVMSRGTVLRRTKSQGDGSAGEDSRQKQRNGLDGNVAGGVAVGSFQTKGSAAGASGVVAGGCRRRVGRQERSGRQNGLSSGSIRSK